MVISWRVDDARVTDRSEYHKSVREEMHSNANMIHIEKSACDKKSE